MLTEQQIKDLVKSPEKPVLKENRELQDSHKVHITGAGYEEAIQQIIGYENVEQYKQKKLLTKPFTRPLTKYIIDAQGRWKTAQGTSKYYKFKGSTDTKASDEFKSEVLSQVWKKDSIRLFIEKFLSEAIYTEFNGFLMIEKGAIIMDGPVKYEMREGKISPVLPEYEPKPYIIFKAACDIYNFSVTGGSVDWIIYKLPKIKRENIEIEIFRVIDDKYDYIVEKMGETITIREDKIEHRAGKCPVVPVSSINKSLSSDETRTSPIDSLIPQLDYYLNQYGEHVCSAILHAHPIYYQVGQKCTYANANAQCDGGELIWEMEGSTQKAVCPSCKGNGANIHKDASTVIILPAKTDQGEAFNITNVAGYVSPPIDILKHQMEELDKIKHEILESATGQTGSQNLTERTATETILNLKPLENIIGEIIYVIESTEKKLTDIIGKMWSDKYEGCEIIYGKRLNLRDDNLILAEIKSSKESGASYFYIRTLAEELIYSRFSQSPSDLQRNLLINAVEPFVGFTFDEIEKSANITEEQKYIKQNFTEYISRLEDEEGDLMKIKGDSDTGVKIKYIKEKLLSYADEDIESAGDSRGQQGTA